MLAGLPKSTIAPRDAGLVSGESVGLVSIPEFLIPNYKLFYSVND